MSKASETEVQYSLTINTENLNRDIRKLEVSLVRIGSYIQRFSGNQDLNHFIDMMQTAILAARNLQMAIRAVELASGPIGWLYAGTSIAASAFSGYSMLESLTGA